MSALKDQDPDYGPSDATNEKHQRIYEENARSSTARKITSIIEREFSQEIGAKEKEVLEIQERLHRASKILHLLRYVIVADFYNRKQCQNSQNGEAKQTQVHPAIKQLIGKSPKLTDNSVLPNSSAGLSDPGYLSVSTQSPSNILDCGTGIKTERSDEPSEPSQSEKRGNDADEETRPKKIPRYIPPKSGSPESQCPSRGVRHKIRKRIIIGNISKWIPPEWREDAASHKWTMYVRGNKENPDIDDFVSKVRFFLHPSYRPNDVVEVTSAPFCLSRRGWGEFPLRVQLHFKSALNKPMDIIHHLKLDRTYTGLQTLGSETLVDIWIYADHRNSNRNTGKITNHDLHEDHRNDCKVKEEEEKVEESIRDSISTVNFIRNSINERKNEDAIPKQEPSDNTVKINDGTIDLKALQFSIELDHDYCGSTFLKGLGGNLTIDHTSSGSVTNKTDSIVTSNNSLENEGVASLKSSKDEIINEDSSLEENDRSASKVLPSSCSRMHLNLRPLEISIPPLFEPSKSKHVLVLENNKTISVDIAVPRTDDHARNSGNDSAKSKLNSFASRGISLLKKPATSETTIQVRNPNGAKAQQGLKIQLSKSVLLNMNSNVPVLKIAEKCSSLNSLPSGSDREAISCEQSGKINIQDSKEWKLSRQKVTLGKDKHKLQSKKEFYEEVLNSIETVKIGNIEGLLRFIVRRMPMVTGNASDPDYRRLHPYACASEEEFFSYATAKRNACEWNRAKMIRCFMKKRSFTEHELWTIKEIMLWCRLHGYTPLTSDFSIRSIKQRKSLPDSTIPKCISTCVEPDSFCKWLQSCPSRSNNQTLDCNSSRSNELDNEIDVENVVGALEKRKGLKDREEQDKGSGSTINKITVLELEKKLLPFYDFVSETAREIGVRLMPEEVIPNVIHCAAGRTIMRAVECLIEDLVRMSLAKAWERCSDSGYPKVIVLDDVRGALLNREEFDIFTNRGLGSKYRFGPME